MNDDVYIAREDVVAKLHELWLARQAKNEASRVDKKISDAMKKWMGDEGEDELFDGEHNIRAFIKPKKRATWDLMYAPAEVLVHLAREGLLDVKETPFHERRQNKPNVLLDQAVDFRHEGETYELRVERKD